MVRWRDPSTHAGWQDEPFALLSEKAQSVGWLLGDNDEGDMLLAASKSEPDYGDIATIPRALISQIVYLDERPKEVG